ncbi:MAG: DUF933 domain-containing protein, partial [Planctomycetales bacterium]
VNTADDESDPNKFADQSTETNPITAAPVGLELELARMPEDERAVFQEELGVEAFSRDRLMRSILDASRQFMFFTAGESEVRTWLLKKNGTALDAAAGIHTDMARGFIRAEVMRSDDLLRLGSERELKAQNLHRKEHKEYVIQDGDILLMHFN